METGTLMKWAGRVTSLNAAIARVASICVPLLVLTLVYEVIVRYVFNAPTLWSYDTSYFLNSILVMLGAGYTLSRRGHIAVDVFYARYPQLAKDAFDLAWAVLILLPMLCALIWALWPNLVQSWESAERAASGTWLPLLYPFKAWILAGFVLLLLQTLVQVLDSVLRLLGAPTKAG
jgi:TRAP-type mannitol/chloroaromatic compound transport system permease small subunit